MATVNVTLTDDEVQQLSEAATGRETTPEALATRWIRERLVHERERAAGGGEAKSPRARRAQGGAV
jgi:hypothetical protein